ncbi:hypothetical protein BAUCODRAFT_333348 [Baudoinia panamericana UAMH 10762]|uniref:Uncharacterized protein n=1 Tax=Baudoinia panamericana (strain UAMH 10762) TaxID=717646 RepID=M2M3E1_BAUPA|nr:uncharacterized protein BAUCODRAFT_333348 [Baudoinia panamericana UAMH 10762]EMC91041.1 hypothetical protein BAUCODRAFT_333348 [Baudoinia panamericana UAMH 10762]
MKIQARDDTDSRTTKTAPRMKAVSRSFRVAKQLSRAAGLAAAVPAQAREEAKDQDSLSFSSKSDKQKQRHSVTHQPLGKPQPPLSKAYTPTVPHSPIPLLGMYNHVVTMQ